MSELDEPFFQSSKVTLITSFINFFFLKLGLIQTINFYQLFKLTLVNIKSIDMLELEYVNEK